MPDGLRINADEWETFYRRTNAVAKDLKSKIRRRMREVVKPLGPDIVREGAADLRPAAASPSMSRRRVARPQWASPRRAPGWCSARRRARRSAA
ncbi:MAG: hypothetical protein IPJ61_20965 [Tessaracoccus sp.]|uniref:hypothetical protein n=1 Tax=Tessaracoccus sp. TaxID=1971211 RepID=UPI001EB992D8|nr:hypothetical protein [Tessaracoccus sp.]MBK7823461.1 hypothetical protein [Tessaracoccus sp.]